MPFLYFMGIVHDSLGLAVLLLLQVYGRCGPSVAKSCNTE